MTVLLAMGSGAALGLIGGMCLSVLWLLAFWPLVFGSTFVLARFVGYSYCVTLVCAIGAVIILQAAYLAGALLRPPDGRHAPGGSTRVGGQNGATIQTPQGLDGPHSGELFPEGR